MALFSRAPQRLAPASPSRSVRAERLSPPAHPCTPFLSYLVLLRVGFAMPRALLHGRCALTAPFHPYLRLAPGAVYSLWHFPSNGLKAILPDVIRHTALRSSDFPLSWPCSPGKPGVHNQDSDHPVQPQPSYYKMNRPWQEFIPGVQDMRTTASRSFCIRLTGSR